MAGIDCLIVHIMDCASVVCFDCLSAAEHLKFALLDSLLQHIALVLDLCTDNVSGDLFTLMDSLEVTFLVNFGDGCLFLGL